MAEPDAGSATAPTGGQSSAGVTATAAPPPIATFDFRHPPRIGRAKRASLDTIFGRFAMSLQAFFSSRLRTATDVVVRSLEQGSFGDFVSSLPAPCAAVVFDVRTTRQFQGVIDIGVDLGFFLIDRLLGGSGQDSNPDRPMTPLEQTIIRGLADNILKRFVDAWKDDLVFTAAFSSFESFPEVLAASGRDESVLMATVELRGGSFEDQFVICMPIRVLEPFLEERVLVTRPEDLTDEERRHAVQQIETSLRAARLELSARLPAFTMRAGDLARLQRGQVVHTGHHLERPVELLVNDQRRFTAAVGVVRQHLGVRIIEPIDVHRRSKPAWQPKGRLV